MPASFQKFPNCRTTVDCTEISIQIPDSTNNKSSTYTAYKARNTLKVMVGVAPNGTVEPGRRATLTTRRWTVRRA